MTIEDSYLIAAAPELLEALETLVACHTEGGYVKPDLDVLANARAAIAQAEQMTSKTLPMSLGDGLCLLAAWLHEHGEPERSAIVDQAIPIVDAFPAVLEACRRAAILCDQYADGAPDSPGYARDCNRVGEILEQAISKAT